RGCLSGLRRCQLHNRRRDQLCRRASPVLKWRGFRRRNFFSDAIEKGGDKTLIGCFLNLGSSLTAEIIGIAGFDWALIDLEHGAGFESHVLHQLQALGATPAAALIRGGSWGGRGFYRS